VRFCRSKPLICAKTGANPTGLLKKLPPSFPA
jgi:hypothetical protein